MIRWLIAAALALLGIAAALGWFVSEQFLTRAIGEYNQETEREVLARFGLGEISRQAVQFSRGDVVLAGTYFPHPEPNECAVILLPGIGGSRTQILGILTTFRSLGCHALAYDHRGTGASSRVLRTFGDFEKHDNAAAIEWLAERTGLPYRAIGVWGPSFGGAVAVLTLEVAPELSFVIADSTFANFERVSLETVAQLSHPALARLVNPIALAMLEWRTGMRIEHAAPDRVVAHARTPILLIHALEDPAMDVSHSEALYAMRRSELVELAITDWGAGHADSALVDRTRYDALLQNFFARHETTQHLSPR